MKVPEIAVTIVYKLDCYDILTIPIEINIEFHSRT